VTGGVAQQKGPEFKPQYRGGKKKKGTKNLKAYFFFFSISLTKCSSDIV
jgi:hypothetical protein